jgi:hypothetical protein
MKAQGIIIMTILVEVETESTRTMLRNCATKPEYAFTPTSAQLNSTFTTIANELSSLRLYR